MGGYYGGDGIVNLGLVESEGDSIIINASTFTNQGTLKAVGGGFLFVAQSTNFSGGTLTGGTWEVFDNSKIQLWGGQLTNNAATIVLDGANSQFDDLSALAFNDPGGSLVVQNGFNLITAPAFANSGAVTIAAGGIVTTSSSYTQSSGSTQINGQLASPAVQINVGIFEGAGRITGDVTNGSQIDLGLATFSIVGNYSQNNSGILNIQLGGLQNFSVLAVSGTASINGLLNVELSSSYIPTIGDSFPLVTFDSYIGAFAAVDIPSATSFATNYHPTDVTLVCAPAAVVINPTFGLITTTSGGTAQFSVALDTQPNANVTIAMNSSDTNEGTIQPSALTFTPQNWNVPQAVTVTGVDDGDVHPDAHYSIQAAATVSADPRFNGLASSAVVVTNQETRNRDLQVTNLSVTPTNGLTAGVALIVTWDDTNTGDTATMSSWTDSVVIKNLTTGETLISDTVPYNADAHGPLDFGKSFGQQYGFTLPSFAAGAGQLQFIVTVNSNQAVFERNGTGTAVGNNTSSIILPSIFVAPDLVVQPNSVIVSVPGQTASNPATG